MQRVDPRIIRISKWIAAQLSQDRDVVLIISGPERAGKSSLAYWIGDTVSFFTGQQFGVDNFVWHGGEMVNKLWAMPETSVIIEDEAGYDLYKRESTSRLNRQINKALMVSGLRNQCVILCVPNMWDLDKFISQRRGLIWIDVSLRYSTENLKLIRGQGTVRSHLTQSTWDKPAYWATEYSIFFNEMPYKFKVEYKKKKAAETKKRVDELSDKGNGQTENMAETRIKLALDIRELAKQCIDNKEKLTDERLRSVLKRYGVKNKPYFYQVKKKHLQNKP